MSISDYEERVEVSSEEEEDVVVTPKPHEAPPLAFDDVPSKPAVNWAVVCMS